MNEIMLHSPDLLHIREPGGLFTFGANQEWYATEWQRKAGCGPTAFAHLVWYLSRTRPDLKDLCPFDASSRAGFLSLMNTAWEYITPGIMGVNSTSLFTRGAERYASDRGISLSFRAFEIPPLFRPPVRDARDFIRSALALDLPVAFLNLSNGKLKNLDNWHWVTLLSLDLRSDTAVMYDQGKKSSIDLSLWLETTTLGGGFVSPDGEI